MNDRELDRAIKDIAYFWFEKRDLRRCVDFEKWTKEPELEKVLLAWTEYEKGLVLMTHAVQELYFGIKDPNQ